MKSSFYRVLLFKFLLVRVLRVFTRFVRSWFVSWNTSAFLKSFKDVVRFLHMFFSYSFNEYVALAMDHCSPAPMFIFFFFLLPFSISVTSVSLVESVLLAELSCRSLYDHYQIALDDGHSSIVTFKLNPKRRNILYYYFSVLLYFPRNVRNEFKVQVDNFLNIPRTSLAI